MSMTALFVALVIKGAIVAYATRKERNNAA